ERTRSFCSGTWRAGSRMITYDTQQIPHSVTSLITNMVHFADDPRNLRFVLSTDGMNPFSQMSSSHSVWPVLVSIYNFPPWLCNKRKYMLMSTIISGPHQPGIDIDVYMRPLVDDLKTLWSEGVQVYDAYKRAPFTLRGLLFTTITDIL